MDLCAKLYYDFDEIETSSAREVETLKLNPLDYVCHVDETGTSLAMEMKIAVLTSAHEGAYFRIRVMATDKESQDKHYDCFSGSIKVFSKRSQIRKIVEKQANPEASVGSKTSKAGTKSLKRKRATSEEEDFSSITSIPESPYELGTSPDVHALLPSSNNLQEILQKLEEQQRAQSFLLQQVLQNQTSSHSFSSGPSELEQAFGTFLSAYQRSSSDERKSKMRKVLKQLDAPSLDMVTEFVDLYSTEGNYPFPEPTHLGESSCNEKECPHKQQLEAFDAFYSEFMREPIDLLNSGEISSLLQAKDFLQASKLLNQLKQTKPS